MNQDELKELESLLSALFENEGGERVALQSERLTALLKSSAAARAMYLDYCEMHTLLQWEHGVLGGLEKSALPAQLMPQPRSVQRGDKRALWLAGIAAMVLLTAGALIGLRGPASDELVADVRSDDFVARLTGSKDATWLGRDAALNAGDYLEQGRRLEIQTGFAEVTFNSGAQVILEGPTSLDLSSAWEAVLRHGTLKANVPAEAIGFRIASPSVEVIDLGTEFSMQTDAAGETEVFVLKGSVQAAHTDSDRQNTGKILLKEQEARRFGKSGVGEVKDRERKVARWAKPVALEHAVMPGGFVHWSFDETNGRLAKAELNGSPREAFNAFWKSTSKTLSVEGRFKSAAHFDGETFARIPFPNISNNAARSVVFWMKLPPDSLISEGDTVLAWVRKDRKRIAARAVQIGWNSNPAQGSIGTLRTEIGRGFVTGSTPLRDGKWHHIAILIVPGEKPGSPVHVSQYVDGRLDGVTSTRSRRSGETGDFDEPAGEIVFLGRGIGEQKREKFRGDLDELFIFERALTHRDIRGMMAANTPPRSQ